jgi:hypothetical protein
VDFVARTCGADGSAAVPPEERVAVFDNDGTLWCEKPMSMVELLTYLAANGFATFIASGGGRDFMRPISQDITASPASGSSAAAPPSPTPATSAAAPSPTSPRADYLDDGPGSRSGSGTAPADAQCSRPGTPTATSQCSSSPTTPTSRHCGSSYSTMTPSASSTKPAVVSKHSDEPKSTGGPWSVSGRTGPPSSDLESSSRTSGRFGLRCNGLRQLTL